MSLRRYRSVVYRDNWVAFRDTSTSIISADVCWTSKLRRNASVVIFEFPYGICHRYYRYNCIAFEFS